MPKAARSVALRSILSASMAAGVCAALASAQSVRLNGPLARPIGGDVVRFEQNADATRIVYLADQRVDDVFELFSVKPGAQAVLLRGAASSSTDVDAFHVSPDGQRVVYLMRQGGQSVLFSVPIGGGASAPLNGPLVQGGNARSTFTISADSQRVVFEADAHVDDVVELFSAPIDGSAPAVELDRDEGSVRFSVVAPDSSRVVFQAHSAAGEAIFAAPIDGSQDPVQLQPSAITSSNLSIRITSDSRRVLYAVTNALFSADIDGVGTPVELSAGTTFRSYELSSDGQRAVYDALLPSDRVDLYSVPVLGGTRVLLASSVLDLTDIQIDAASSHALYVSGHRLRSVPILGGAAPIALSPSSRFARGYEPVASGHVLYTQDDGLPLASRTTTLVDAAVDGSTPPVTLAELPSAPLFPFRVTLGHVYYVTRAATQGIDLVSVPRDGSTSPVRLHQPLFLGQMVQSFLVSDDDLHAVFVLNEDPDAFELFIAPSDGSQAEQRLNPPLAPGPIRGSVTDARLTGDGATAVYLADENEDQVFELFSVPFLGHGTTVRISDPLVPGGDVIDFRLQGDSVVYRATQELVGVRELFGVSATGGAPTRLSVAGSECGPDYRLSPDGARVVYQADEDHDGQFELDGAPTDGSSPSVRLSAGLSPTPAPVEFALSPLSDRVAYIADPEHDGIMSLFSVPLAGGAITKLDDGRPGKTLGGLRFTANGQRLVYSYELPGRFVLRSVPAAGGTPLKFSGNLPATVSVGRYDLTSDGHDAVFVVKSSLDGTSELLRAPVDASAAPVRLHALNPISVELGPDDRVAAYFVISVDRLELHAVPSDGSGPEHKLTDPLRFRAAVLGVPRIVFTPASERIVFSADVFPRTALLSVPSDGSAPAIELSHGEEYENVEADFQLTADGKTALFRMGSTFEDMLLFRVPVAGNRAPQPLERRNASFFVEAEGFELSPDGSQVLLRSTEDSFRVIELYRVALDLHVRPGGL